MSELKPATSLTAGCAGEPRAASKEKRCRQVDLRNFKRLQAMKITLRTPIRIELERKRPLDYVHLMEKKPSVVDKIKLSLAHKLDRVAIKLRGDK